MTTQYTLKSDCCIVCVTKKILLSQVDVIYVGTIHPKHVEATMMMLEAGKHVLCEKPLTCSAEETRALIKAAKEKGVFFMEVWG